jgi:hypothetical protein
MLIFPPFDRRRRYAAQLARELLVLFGLSNAVNADMTCFRSAPAFACC